MYIYIHLYICTSILIENLMLGGLVVGDEKGEGDPTVRRLVSYACGYMCTYIYIHVYMFIYVCIYIHV
jgi:hypothetical protein